MSGSRRGTTAPPDIVFDLGGVLVDWDPRYLLCGELGMSTSAAETFLERVCSREWHAEIDGGRRFAEVCLELTRLFPEHEAEIHAYARDWQKMFAGEFGATTRLLVELRRAGCRLHALSNYPGEQIAFLYRRFAFMREFETVILSGLVGMQKPAADIFEYLVERIGTRDCVFLDDREDNVAAARAAGIRAIRYTPPSEAADLAEILEQAGLLDFVHGRLPSSNALV